MTNGNSAYRDAYFEVRDGLRLHYRDYPGSSALPPLLCLHGLTRNARDFSQFAERYSPRFRVLVLEFRGRGDSDFDPHPARYTPLTYAADVIELLDQLSIPKAIFVGTSLGGLVTMAVAAMASKRIAGTILNDVGPELKQQGLDRIGSYISRKERFATWEDAAAAIARNQASAFPGYGTEDWLAMAHRNCRERDGAIVFDYDPAIVVPFETSGATPNVDLWPLFSSLAEKLLLVVRGELSDLLDAETAEKMREVAPTASFATVPGVGHAPDLNEPGALAAIDSFLEAVAENFHRG